MNIKSKLNKSELKTAKIIKDKIENAEVLVIGAGAGLSASAGLNYGDEKFFADEYTPFLKAGYRTIGEGISDNWYLNEKTALKYWGFWVNHINNIYYRQSQLETYNLLYDLLKDKNHFIITTNGDGQFYKGNFDTEKIFAMQGSYSEFQCQKNCSDKVYDNKEMIERMLAGFDSDSLTIRQEDIPRCSDCGELLIPHLRIDGYFAEGNNAKYREKYIDFINSNADKRVLFMELGVGYNTPVIIRFPFEQMTEAIADGELIRVNQNYPEVSEKLGDKALGTTMDIDGLLRVIA